MSSFDPEVMAAALRSTSQPGAPRETKRARPGAQPTAARAPAAVAPKRPSKKTVLPRRPAPDFSGLPPAMAQSLARLAGVPWPPQEGQSGAADDERELEDEGAPTGKTGR
jgi:hypothetical protein